MNIMWKYWWMKLRMLLQKEFHPILGWYDFLLLPSFFWPLSTAHWDEFFSKVTLGEASCFLWAEFQLCHLLHGQNSERKRWKITKIKCRAGIALFLVLVNFSGQNFVTGVDDSVILEEFSKNFKTIPQKSVFFLVGILGAEGFSYSFL